MAAGYRDQVLANEARTELKGSVVGWVALATGTGFLAVIFADRAEPAAFAAWLAAMSVLLFAWLAAWIAFTLTRPSDADIVARWIPGAKLTMTLCNVATAGSVWVFLPAAEPDLRALLEVFFAWYLIIQFAAATEATQVLVSAVILVLGSLIAWLLVARPPYYLALSLFLPMFGASLVAIRRFVRQAVVQATQARAAADAARRELERERDAKTHFIRAASHDLQQPLHAASLFLDRVRPGVRAVDQASALQGLRKALTAARSLVEAMLGHLSLEGGAVRPEMTDVPARELFERVMLTQAAAAAEARVRVSIAAQKAVLHTDPVLLARAVENLVANALRHSGARRVVLGVRQRRGEATIWVVDNGCGLTSEDAERIFRPFEQGARVGAAGGFGLGLASSRGLAELMGGRCGVRSAPGRGSAFYINLPARQALPSNGASCAA